MVESTGNLLNFYSVKANHKVNFGLIAIQSRSERLFALCFDLQMAKLPKVGIPLRDHLSICGHCSIMRGSERQSLELQILKVHSGWLDQILSELSAQGSSLGLPPHIHIPIVRDGCRHISLRKDLDHILVTELFNLCGNMGRELLFAQPELSMDAGPPGVHSVSVVCPQLVVRVRVGIGSRCP